MVPVAPRRKRLLSEGDKKLKGLSDSPRADGLRKIDKTYKAMLT